MALPWSCYQCHQVHEVGTTSYRKEIRMVTVQMIFDQLNRDRISDADIQPGDLIASVRIAPAGEASGPFLYLSPSENEGSVCRTPGGSTFTYADSIGSTMNRILEILDHIAQWESALQHAIRRGCTLTELLDLAYPVITFPLIILDDHQWMIACSSVLKTKENYSTFNEDITEMLRFRTSKPERIAEFNKTYSSCFSKRDVYKIPGDFFSNTGYAFNLFQGNRFCGVMLVDSFGESISQGKLDLFSLLGSNIQDMINDPSSGLSIDHEEPSLLNYLGSPNEENAHALLRDLRIAGWKEDDEKQFIFMMPGGGKSLSPNLGHAVTMFYRLFDLIAAPYRNGILLFLNLRIVHERSGYEAILQRIGQLSYCAGMSNSFTDIHRLSVMAERACISLEQGDKNAGAINHFEDCYLQYFFHLKEQSDRDILRHPFPERLREYDRRHGSCLYRTLFVYLKNERGITRCAKEMNISRSTLLHRIERIGELANGILDDPDIRLHILLSYYLEQNTLHQTPTEEAHEKLE